MDVDALAAEIDAGLRAGATPERAGHEKAYLRSELEHYGTSVPAVRSVVARVRREHPHLAHDELFSLVGALWTVPVHERRMAAVELLEQHSSVLSASDMGTLEHLIRESRTWALADGLAASVVGPLVERDPAAAAQLDGWADDSDLWIRRSALLALLVALRRGGGDFDRFGRYADGMLADREPFIRKAIGWVLRDTARRRPQMVVDWLLPRAGRASALTVREAVKPLSTDQRQAILAARDLGG